jgi:hypothetical protein
MPELDSVIVSVTVLVSRWAEEACTDSLDDVREEDVKDKSFGADRFLETLGMAPFDEDGLGEMGRRAGDREADREVEGRAYASVTRTPGQSRHLPR